ncbi:shikimate dehydrogenase [Denitratisoma sp. agr-D3]
MTDLYAVFGNPVAHSKSPLIHGLFAAQTGQDLRYEARLAPLDGFAAAVAAFRAEGGRGANVTVPFKEEAFRLSTRLTPRAEAAGAVNTLVFAADGILGDNTDGSGLVADIRGNAGNPIAGQRVLLLGAGGATRGALLPLLEQQPSGIFIANRTADKARALAAAAGGGIEAGGFADLAGRRFDLVINATAASLADAELPLPAGIFAPDCLAYDMMYGKDTPFLRQARTAGARTLDGLGMLVEQAAEAFFLWRGLRPATGPVLDRLRQG